MRFNARQFPLISFWAFCFVFIFLSLGNRASGQSSDIEFPTAITENQVNGLIKARDIGDPRLTTFYYTFNGLQGDLFINVVTKNLSGSVDVFLSDGMRPLSNIIVYADVVQSETGRVIYLRKPDKLILRVQGRTPNDDPAEFQIKFAGGFEAATPTKDETPIPKVPGAESRSGIRVNSVGTIVALPPKPKPTPAEVAKVDEKREESKPVEEKPNPEPAVEEKPENKTVENAGAKNTEPEKKETATVESKAVPVKTKTPRPKPTRSKANQTTANISPSEKPAAEPENSDKQSEPTVPASQSKPEVVVTDTTAKTDAEPARKESAKVTANPLANVRLVILLKDGTKIERPMTEVFRFTADQSTLTVIGTNGRVSKFPILNVASVTIQ